jgi:hypothetical protein
MEGFRQTCDMYISCILPELQKIGSDTNDSQYKKQFEEAGIYYKHHLINETMT